MRVKDVKPAYKKSQCHRACTLMLGQAQFVEPPLCNPHDPKILLTAPQSMSAQCSAVTVRAVSLLSLQETFPWSQTAECLEKDFCSSLVAEHWEAEALESTQSEWCVCVSLTRIHCCSVRTCLVHLLPVAVAECSGVFEGESWVRIMLLMAVFNLELSQQEINSSQCEV